MLDEGLTSLIDKSEDGNIDVSDVIALKKNVSKTCTEYDLTFEQFKDKLEDFKFSNEEKIKPNLLPLISITLAANGGPIAEPTIIKAVGSVARYWMFISLEPIIPLNKTVTVGDVKENI